MILKYLESLYLLQKLQKQDKKCDEELKRAIEEKELKSLKDDIEKLQSKNLKISKENLIIKQRISELENKSEEYYVNIRHLEKAIYGGEVTNMKELSALQERISKLKSKVEEIDNEAIELMVKAETIKNKICLEKQKIRKLELTYHKIKLESLKKINSIKKEQEAIKIKIQQLLNTIPKSYLNKYCKIKKHKSDPVAYIENNRCGGCKMMISNLVIEKAHKYDEVIYCENCGRILI